MREQGFNKDVISLDLDTYSAQHRLCSLPAAANDDIIGFSMYGHNVAQVQVNLQLSQARSIAGVAHVAGRAWVHAKVHNWS